MNPQKKVSKHQQTEQQQETFNQHQNQQPAVCEFATVEELLRHDAANTPVPDAIARRLEDSACELPAPRRRSWWRRLLGGADS